MIIHIGRECARPPGAMQYRPTGSSSGDGSSRPGRGIGARGRPVNAIGDVTPFCVAALSMAALFVAPIAARRWGRAPVSVLRRLPRFVPVAIAVRLILWTRIGVWSKRRNCVYLGLVPVHGF